MHRTLVFLFFCLIVLGLTSVQAEGPRNLQAQFDSPFVALKWSPPESDSMLSFYRILRSTGFHVPSVVGTTTDTTFTDSSVALNTFYVYAVVAVNTDSQQTDPSNLAGVYTGTHLTDTGFVTVTFTSTPPDSGKVGTLIDYTPTVTTNPAGAKVCFSLGDDSPENMTINDSTGEIQWTPVYPGMYFVKIVARVCDGRFGGGEQKFVISVFAGKPGSVVGVVTNDSGTGIGNVRITLFGFSWDEFVLRTETDATGHYGFPMVNPASYYVRADPGDSSGYLPQWYNNASHIEDATPVVVPESTTVTVNFTLHHRDTTHYTLSGTVSDSSSQPIAGAMVTIYRTDHDTTDNAQFDEGDGENSGGTWFGGQWGEWDRHYGGDRDAVGEAITDSTGKYSVRLRGGIYILSARKEGYVPEFWNGKSSPLDADHLQLVSDTTGINFTLLLRTQYTGSISGFIKSAADSTPVRSHVIGFLEDSSGHPEGCEFSARTDSTGAYTLEHLPNGNYIVLALAGDNFIPTFYNLSGGTPFIDSATGVSVTGGAVTGINIYLAPDSADGLNRISGVITGAGNSAGSPLAGVIVTATNSSNFPVGSTVSLANGSYTLSGLAPGTYTTTFQSPGYVSASSKVSVAYTSTSPGSATLNAQMIGSSGGQLGVLSLRSNWNLVSLPVTVTDAQLSTLFPTASSSAFSYDASGSSYATSTTLDYGTGYWLRFSSGQMVALSGAARTSETVTLYPGWNLIGTVSASVPVSAVTSSPPNIVNSDFFGYSGGYAVATSLDPGQGYWVKATGGGTISVASSAAVPSTTAQGSASISKKLNSLTIRDAAGNSQVLYFGDKALVDQSRSYELPPLGPDGTFDIRFASQKYVALHSTVVASAEVFPVQIRSAAGPLTVSWVIRNNNTRYDLVDASGKPLMSRSMTGTGSVKLTSTTVTGLKLVASASGLPKEYALHQNYPNPFNPSTTITFDLPVTSVVSLKVYNILGQEVSTLLDGVQLEGGVHIATFNASNIPSGVYFYQLRAGSFTATRKLMLMK